MLGHMTQIAQQLAWQTGLVSIFSCFIIPPNGQPFEELHKQVGVTCLKLVYAAHKIERGPLNFVVDKAGFGKYCLTLVLF